MSQRESNIINYRQQPMNILSDNREVSAALDRIWDIFAVTD